MSSEQKEIQPLTPSVEIMTTNTAAAMVQSEIHSQVATAHAYPRDITIFREQAMQLATIDEETAADCLYALPRGNKAIEGPSIRLAEIVAHTYGNCRAGSRVINEEEKYITAQGVFHDLERNVAFTSEIRRRITYSDGKRYNDDMVAMTANAACSIAMRNAIFKGVPKALWSEIYDGAKKLAIGDVGTLDERRDAALSYLEDKGISLDRVFKLFDIESVDDIGLGHLGTLRAFITSINRGEVQMDKIFPEPTAHAEAVSGLKDIGKKAAPEETSTDEGDADAGTDETEGDIDEANPPSTGPIETTDDLDEDDIPA